MLAKGGIKKSSEFNALTFLIPIYLIKCKNDSSLPMNRHCFYTLRTTANSASDSPLNYSRTSKSTNLLSPNLRPKISCKNRVGSTRNHNKTAS